jgi:hypothetical protein
MAVDVLAEHRLACAGGQGGLGSPTGLGGWFALSDY